VPATNADQLATQPVDKRVDHNHHCDDDQRCIGDVFPVCADQLIWGPAWPPWLAKQHGLARCDLAALVCASP